MELENKLKELEMIVEKLEGGSISLESSIELFEKGVTITKECLTTLSQKKHRIETIKKEMDDILKQS